MMLRVMRLAVHGNVHLMPAGGSVVCRRDVGPPAIGCTHALHIAKVGLHSGCCIAGHAGDAQAHNAALLHPLGGKLHLRAGLQGEPEGITIPAGGLCGLFQPQIFAHCAGAAALKLGGHAALRHPPDRSALPYIRRWPGTESSGIRSRCPQTPCSPDSRLDGQGGVAGPVRQGDGRVGRVQRAQLLHREGGGAGKHLIQLSADAAAPASSSRWVSSASAAELRGSCPGSRPRW